jgi:cell division septum initiation protein DivIVA
VARLNFSGGKRDQRQGRAAEKTAHASAPVAPVVGSTPDAPPMVEQSPPTGRDFDRLGDHVSSILSAAEEAAIRIQEEARQEAERVREQAQKEAAASAEAARQDTDAIRADAERLRADAKESTTEARQAADTYAANKRADAETKAREFLAKAERQAAASDKDAERRQRALKTDISLTEERLRQLATGLRELATRLDKLVAAPIGEGGGSGVADEGSLLAAVRSPREKATTP